MFVPTAMIAKFHGRSSNATSSIDLQRSFQGDMHSFPYKHHWPVPLSQSMWTGRTPSGSLFGLDQLKSGRPMTMYFGSSVFGSIYCTIHIMACALNECSDVTVQETPLIGKGTLLVL